MSGIAATEIALYVAVGLALGAAYFVLLSHTVRLHVANAPTARIVPGYVVRLGAAVAVFWVVAQQGALPLLLTLAGFLAARFAVRRFLRWG